MAEEDAIVCNAAHSPVLRGQRLLTGLDWLNWTRKRTLTQECPAAAIGEFLPVAQPCSNVRYEGASKPKTVSGMFRLCTQDRLNGLLFTVVNEHIVPPSSDRGGTALALGFHERFFALASDF